VIEVDICYQEEQTNVMPAEDLWLSAFAPEFVEVEDVSDRLSYLEDDLPERVRTSSPR
jgi:hypothetical protein